MFGVAIFIMITFFLFAGLENNIVKAETIMQISESKLTILRWCGRTIERTLGHIHV